MNPLQWFVQYIFNPVFFYPITNLLLMFYKIFLVIRIPGAFGFSIIVLTVLVRMLLHPFFKQQLETAKKMQELKPHLDRLSEKHKKEPQKLQQEQMKLYQEAGINPASGCLFMILQMPIFIALYQALYEPFKHGSMAAAVQQLNKIAYSFSKISTIDPWFFGLNLALSPSKADSLIYYAVPVITAILQYYQVKLSTPQIQSQVQDASKDRTDKKADTGGDFQKAMNTQMKFIFPLMIGWFSYTLPVGLSLYWNIFSIFSIVQYGKINTKSQALIKVKS